LARLHTGAVLAWGLNFNGQTTVPAAPSGSLSAGIGCGVGTSFALRMDNLASMNVAVAASRMLSGGTNVLELVAPPATGGTSPGGGTMSVLVNTTNPSPALTAVSPASMTLRIGSVFDHRDGHRIAPRIPSLRRIRLRSRPPMQVRRTSKGR
jgi:hypothetical protein